MRCFVTVGMPVPSTLLRGNDGPGVTRLATNAHPIAMSDQYILNTAAEDDAPKSLARIMGKFGHQ